MPTSPTTYDPRIGDEELSLEDLQDATGNTKSDNQQKEEPSSSSSDRDTDGGADNEEAKNLFKLPSSLQWVPANFTWSKVKPVIRCAISAWVSLLLVIIPQTSKFLGQVSMLSM